MESKRQLKGTRLLTAQKQVIDELYSEVANPTGKFAFYTQQDSENFSDGTKNLAKADLIYANEIASVVDEIRYKSKAWFERYHELLPVGTDCETTGLSPYTNDFIGIGVVYPKNPEVLDIDNLHCKTPDELQEQSSAF